MAEKRSKARSFQASWSKNKVIRVVVTTIGLAIASALLSIIPNPVSPADAQGPGGIAGTPVVATGSAVVNFAELAHQEALRPPMSGSAQGVAVPSNSYVEPNSTLNPRVPGAPAARTQPSVASPGPSLDYMGLDDIAPLFVPPDTMGAVGLARVFDTLNNNYRVQDKSTGATINTLSMNSFWTSTGATGSFDPKTFYDPYTNRFIVVAVSDSASTASAILVGVSVGSDPNGSYFLFKIPACGASFPCGAGVTDWWADYPAVGFNKNWIAVAVNMFPNAGGNFTQSRLLVVDYTQLLGGTWSAKYFTGLTDFTVQPCVTYSSTENTLYAPVHVNSSAASYRLNTITGTPGNPTYSQGALKTHTLAPLSSGWFSVPSGSNVLPQMAGSGGPGDVSPINSGDSRIMKCTFRNGNIWYSQTIGLPAGGPLTHTAAQWVRLDTGGNDVDGGRVEDPTATSTNGGKWYAYPTLAVNALNDVLMGLTQFASTQWPSAGYVFRSGFDAAGTMHDPYIYKAGEGMYWKTYASPCSTGSNRWGDYSATMVDPADDTTMWTLQEYSKPEGPLTGCDSGVWSTWWARVSIQRIFLPLITK